MRHEQKRILCIAVTAMVTSNSGTKSQKVFIAVQCAATVVTSKDGAKFPQNDKSKALHSS